MDRKMTDLDIEASKNLKRIWDQKRKELGFTQETASERIGIGQSTVSQYLRGTVPLGIEATLKFAYFLGVDPREIRPDLPEWVVTLKSIKTEVSPDLLSLVREISVLSTPNKQVLRHIVGLMRSNEMR
jgi:transcriptional regulator with XRE-family HTH domain